MRVFGWLRRRPTVEEYVGRHRPGSWGTIAFPPTDDTQQYAPATRLAAPPPVTVVAAPPVAAPVTPVDEPVAAAPRQRVRLGFEDGSSVDIEDESRESVAFRRAASRLIDDPL